MHVGENQSTVKFYHVSSDFIEISPKFILSSKYILKEGRRGERGALRLHSKTADLRQSSHFSKQHEQECSAYSVRNITYFKWDLKFEASFHLPGARFLSHHDTF